MAASITDQVPDIAPAGNPMWIDVQTDTYITTPGTPASVIMAVSNYPAPGTGFVLTWGDDALPFVFIAGSPDDSGLEINHIGISIADFTENSLMAALKENYTFNKLFYLSAISGAGPYQFTITAKNAGTNFSLNTYSSDASITFNTNVAGVDEIAQPNFKLFCKVQIENLTNPWGTQEIIEVSGIPTENSVSIPLEFQEAIWAYLNPVRPIVYSTSIDLAEAMLLKYWLQFGEIYGTNPIGKTIQTMPPKWALRSKQIFEDFPAGHFNSLYTTPPDTKFFTNQPRRKTINTKTKEWLYWWLNTNVTDLFLKANIYYTDGTQDLAVVLTNYVLGSVIGPNIYIAPAGYAQNKAVLESTAGVKTIAYYDVYIVDDGVGFTSEVFSYVMDYKYYRNNNYLVFLNPLGGYDTIWCKGEKSQSKVVDAETYEISLAHDYAANDAAIKQLTHSTHREMIFNTGWLTPNQQIHLAEFIASEDRMLYIPPIVDDAYGSFLSILSLDKEGEQHNTANNQRSFTFKVRYAFND